MKRIPYIAALLLLTLSTYAQVPAPGEPQSGPILILNGTAHLGDGTVINSAAIAFDQGKITSVTSTSSFTEDQSNYEVIDASGKHIYPGFILPNTDLGLREVNAVRATVDAVERGELKPNIRALPAYNTDSELIPTLRFNGVLTAQITPQGGTISGTSSIVQLDAWNWEDASMKADDGLHVFWPLKKLPPRWWMGETGPQKNENYKKSLEGLTKIFEEVQSYRNNGKSPANLKLDAILGTIEGDQTVYMHVNGAEAIVNSVEFAKKNGVKRIVLVGANDAMYVKEYIKENNLPIILNNLHRLPSRAEEDVDLPYKLPKLLNDEGIKFCLSYAGPANSRNLPFFAGTSVAYGMEKEAALKSITLDAADILGIEDQVGSLAVGKDATLFICDGDALDMKTNIITQVFVQGRKATMEAMQQRLYEKYKSKYGLE